MLQTLLIKVKIAESVHSQAHRVQGSQMRLVQEGVGLGEGGLQAALHSAQGGLRSLKRGCAKQQRLGCSHAKAGPNEGFPPLLSSIGTHWALRDPETAR